MSQRLARPATACVAALALAASAALGSGVAGASLSHQETRIGSAPALPPHATLIGTLPATRVLGLEVALEPRDPSALATYASEVSDPSSPLYRRYLSVEQFAARFGPSTSAVDAVRSALNSDGLETGKLSSDHLGLAVSGTAARIGAAFSLGFDRYRVGSRVIYANTKAPRLETAVADRVEAVIGLSDLDEPHSLAVPGRPLSSAPEKASSAGRSSSHASGATQPAPDSSGPQPCAAASELASEFGGYTANEIASAYQYSDLYASGDEGAGETVALYELAPTITSDIAKYQSCYGTDTTVDYVNVDGGPGSSTVSSGEPILDIEEIIGLAPDATVDVYQGPNSGTGPYDVYLDIVGADTAQVVSISWGLCEAFSGSATLEAENTLFEEAATQGQSVLAAAGDDGSTTCYDADEDDAELSVSDPASQPYVTGVGGTSLSSTSPLSQSVWNDSAESGGAGGGGISEQWPMPSYQSDAPASLKVVNANSSGSPCSATEGYCREVPDVSADGDPATGYWVYTTQGGQSGWGLAGGTSMAAPEWAALVALTNATSACKDNSTSIGFTNPVLYDVAGGSGYSSSFYDVTSGNNDYTPSGYSGGLYPAGSGYDMASGLGSPNAESLSGALCSLAGHAPSIAVTSRTGPGDVTISGATLASAEVELYEEGYGKSSYSAKASTTSTGTGEYSFKEDISRATHFYVEVDGVVSEQLTSDVTDRLTETLAGETKSVKVRVSTDPAVKGVKVTFERVNANGSLTVMRTAEITASDGVLTETLPTSLSKITIEVKVASGDGALGASSSKHTVKVKR